jgi:SNF family Na+-dependent transporter
LQLPSQLTKLKTQTPISLATIAFYGIVGIIFLALLPLSGFPPHIGLMGIASFITAYGLLMERKWATWLVVALFFVVTTFTLYTLYYIVAIDAVATVFMITYTALTWIFTGVVARKRKISES